MQRERSLGKRLALGCGGLVVVLLVLALAAYVILHVAGGRQVRAALARVKASGAPTTWQQAIPPPIPDDQNAAVLYEKAFAALILSSQAKSEVLQYLYTPSRNERKALEENLRGILNENAQALAYAREAAHRPKCRFDRNWSGAVMMLMPELSPLKSVARLASARAVLQADEGDLASALPSWSLNLSIVNHLDADPTLMGQLTRYNMLHTAATSLQCILADGRPSPEQCRRLSDDLGKVNISDAFVRSLEGERTLSLWILDVVRRDPRGIEPLPRGQGSYPGAAVLAPLTALGYRAISPFDRAAMLRFWERHLALARKPYREGKGRFEGLRDGIPGYALVTRDFTMSFEGAVAARDQALADIGLMRTALGLEAYHTEIGLYPESLEALRKRVRWEVPDDPFSGEDFVYRRRGKGCLLYSLGRDLDDDGGARERILTDSKDPLKSIRDGDMIWPVER